MKSLVKVAGILPGSKVEDIPITLLEADPNQPRKTFKEKTIAELAQNIKGSNLIQPLIVRPHPQETGRYMIIAGERRYLAAKSLHRELVPCIVKREKLSTRDIFILQLAENLNREDLNVIDQAEAFKTLRDEGVTLGEISELTSLSVLTIGNVLKLLKLSKETQAMVRDGRLPRGSALTLAQYQKTNPNQIQEIRLANAIIVNDDEAIALYASLVQETKRGVAVSERKIPETPAQMFRRIMDLAKRSDAYVRAIEAFLRLPTERRREIFGRIPALNRITIRDKFLRLFEPVQRFANLVNDSIAQFPETQREDMVAKDQERSGRGATHGANGPEEKPAVRTERPASTPHAVKPPNVPPPAFSRREDHHRTPVTVHAPISLKQKQQPKPIENPEKLNAFLTAMFYDRNEPSSSRILSLARLRKQLDTSMTDGEIRSLAARTLRSVRANWRLSPDRKSAAENKFLTTASNIRHDLGVRTFEELIAKIEALGRSRDPIELKLL